MKVDWAAVLVQQCATLGLPAPQREYRFHATRRWRFDVAWPEYQLAVEIDGGAFIGGRHTRGAGYRADCEKLNEATAAGWRVFRTLPEWVKNSVAVAYVYDALKRAGAIA